MYTQLFIDTMLCTFSNGFVFRLNPHESQWRIDMQAEVELELEYDSLFFESLYGMFGNLKFIFKC